MLSSFNPVTDIFYCPEESDFYSQCLETLVLKHCINSETIIEFGSGEGSPVIQALLRSKFSGTINGYELDTSAANIAFFRINQAKLRSKYIVHNKCFFKSSRPEADYLISNPPYLPAPDNKIYKPYLHGGTEGNQIAQELLSLGYKNVMLLVSSYSHPEGLINYAKKLGYCVASFFISPLTFGQYSSEPKVKQRIAELRNQNRAFYSENVYLLAGVLFTKRQKMGVDLSGELLRTMTSL